MTDRPPFFLRVMQEKGGSKGVGGAISQVSFNCEDK